MSTLLHAVRELAQKWRKRAAECGGHEGLANMECADELLALADRAEAESQREGRENAIAWGITVHDQLCNVYLNKDEAEMEFKRREKMYPESNRRLIELFATPSHPQPECT